MPYGINTDNGLKGNLKWIMVNFFFRSMHIFAKNTIFNRRIFQSVTDTCLLINLFIRLIKHENIWVWIFCWYSFIQYKLLTFGRSNSSNMFSTIIAFNTLMVLRDNHYFAHWCIPCPLKTIIPAINCNKFITRTQHTYRSYNTVLFCMNTFKVYVLHTGRPKLVCSWAWKALL